MEDKTPRQQEGKPPVPPKDGQKAQQCQGQEESVELEGEQGREQRQTVGEVPEVGEGEHVPGEALCQDVPEEALEGVQVGRGQRSAHRAPDGEVGQRHQQRGQEDQDQAPPAAGLEEQAGVLPQQVQDEKDADKGQGGVVPDAQPQGQRQQEQGTVPPFLRALCVLCGESREAGQRVEGQGGEEEGGHADVGNGGLSPERGGGAQGQRGRQSSQAGQGRRRSQVAGPEAGRPGGPEQGDHRHRHAHQVQPQRRGADGDQSDEQVTGQGVKGIDLRVLVV
jgi:hypothetical protein